MYTLRDTNGIMRAKFTNEHANMIFKKFDGYFKEANYDKGSKVVFIFTENWSYSAPNGEVFYFWEGDRLVPK